MQRILVVDDERLVADTLTLIFIKHGFNARAVYSAEEAMVVARMFLPELLLCDITMPGKDGMELMEQISVEQPDCRILVLTGNYASLVRVHEKSMGLMRPANILTKPCQPAELLREAGLLLAQRVGALDG